MELNFRIYDKRDDFFADNNQLFTEDIYENSTALATLKYFADDNTKFLSVFDGLFPVLCCLVRNGSKLYLVKSTTFVDDEIVDFLIDRLTEFNVRLTAVYGEENLVKSFAKKFQIKSKAVFVQTREIAVMAATECKTAEPTDGVMRKAELKDAHVLTTFMLQMTREIRNISDNYEKRKLSVINHIDYFWVWEVNGVVVSCLKAKPLDNGALISNVFTPAEKRGNGYCTSLVSSFTEKALESNDFLVLSADVFNPVSTHIYSKLGYETVGKSLEGNFFIRQI